MSKPNAKEAILDWFDRNPTAKTRATPLAKALKLGQAIVAVTCANLAEPGGPLIRCKVNVKMEDRANGGPKEQWEYCKAMSAAPAPVKPYVPPTVPRRPTGVIVRNEAIDWQPTTNPPAASSQVEEDNTAVAAVLEQTNQAAAPSPALSEYLAWQSLGEKYGCTTPDELQTFIDELEKKCVDAMQAEQEASTQLAQLSQAHGLEEEAAIANINAAFLAHDALNRRVEHPDAPTIRQARMAVFAGYIVTRASKPPRRFTKFTNAQANALSAARADGLAKLIRETTGGGA